MSVALHCGLATLLQRRELLLTRIDNLRLGLADCSAPYARLALADSIFLIVTVTR